MNTGVISISEYRQEDYQRIRELSVDRDEMHETWKEWEAGKKKGVKKFKKMGVRLVDVLVLPDELEKYCQERNVPIDGKARSQFVERRVR